MAQNLKLSCFSITEENLDSIEVLKNTVSIHKLLDSKNSETLARNAKKIIDNLNELAVEILTKSSNQENTIHQILQKFCPEVLEYSEFKNFMKRSQPQLKS